MNRRSKKIALSLLSSAIILLGFQNCADDLDLTQIQLASLPSVSFAPTEIDPIENSSFEIRMELRNIDNATYRWEKDGQIIGGEIDTTLTFESLEFSDNGQYEGVAIVSDREIYRTGLRELRVEADPNEPLVQTIVNPRLTLNNNSYTMLTNANRTPAQHNQLTEEYCKAVFGPQASSTGYNDTPVIVSSFRYVVWFVNGITCPVTTYDGQLGPGFCLYTRPTGAITTQRYTSISCNRFPAYVAP